MDMQAWIKLLGATGDDPALKAALAAAGVKKVPKLGREGVNKYIELKGHGLYVQLSDEALLKRLKDQPIGKRVVLVAVDALIDTPKARSLYEGRLPYKLAAGMTCARVQKLLGAPDDGAEDIPYDAWHKGRRTVTIGFTRELAISHVEVSLRAA